MLGLHKAKQSILAGESAENSPPPSCPVMDTTKNQDEGEDEDEEELERTEDGSRTLSRTPHVTNVDPTKNSNSEVRNMDDVRLTSDTPCAITGQSANATQAVPESGQAPPSASIHASPPPPFTRHSSPTSPLSSSPTSPAQKQTSCNGLQTNPVKKSSTAPISTRLSSRVTAKVVRRVDDDPKYWSFDAGNYLMKALTEFEAQKAVYWLKELDCALGFPKGNVCISLAYLFGYLLMGSYRAKH